MFTKEDIEELIKSQRISIGIFISFGFLILATGVFIIFDRDSVLSTALGKVANIGGLFISSTSTILIKQIIQGFEKISTLKIIQNRISKHEERGLSKEELERDKEVIWEILQRFLKK